MELNILWVALCCWLGGILAALATILSPGGTFVLKQFLYTVITGFVAALIWATAYKFYSPGNFTIYDIIAAIAAGWLAGTAQTKIQTYRFARKQAKKA